MNRFTRVLAPFALVGVATMVSACERPTPNDPKVVAEWSHALYGMVRAERISPPVGARFLAYATTALYAGFSVTDTSLTPLAGILNGFPELPAATPGERYDGTLVAISAERTVLDSLLLGGLPTTRTQVSRLADSLSATRHAPDDVRERSIALGRDIGLRIVQWSHGDGFDSTRTMKYVVPKGPGLWSNDSPADWYSTKNVSGASVEIDFDNPNQELRTGNRSDRDLVLARPKSKGDGSLPAVNMAGVTEPYWGTLRPFAIARWDVCPVDPPPAFGTTPESPLYQDAKVVYDTRLSLTPEQKAIALYWADNPGESGTPAGHWTAIASQLVSQRNLSGAEAVRTTTMTAVAVADAFISAWGYKFQFNLIRPRAYIRAVIDSTWEPFLPTPPFPEFIAGHSTVSAAAATALTALLGSPPFDDSTSMVIGHSPRRFASFLDAAIEAGQSRVYGGMHFPAGNREGGKVGRCVGNAVAAKFGLAEVADAR